MNPARLGEFWKERSLRERALLGGGAAAIALVALYLFLWQPGLAASQRLSTTLPKLRAQVELMRAQQAEIVALKKKGSAVAQGADIRALLQASVERAPFAKSVQRMDATSAERVTLIVSAADFGDWMRWAADAQREAGARLERCRISALDAPGMVRAEATFVAISAAAKR